MAQDIVNSTLQQQLDDFKAQLAQQMPDTVARLGEDAEALVRTGIASQSLKEGEQAPDFTLPDAFGHSVTLSEFLKRGPVVLTFYRGEWCPYCNLQLRAYQQILPQIKELGATLIALSPQTADNSLSTVEKAELTFIVLSDLGNVVARQYRLVFSLAEAIRPLYQSLGNDLTKFNGDSSWELPMPGTFIIDQKGTVRMAFVDADYTRRLEPATLLESLRAVVAEQ